MSLSASAPSIFAPASCSEGSPVAPRRRFSPIWRRAALGPVAFTSVAKNLSISAPPKRPCAAVRWNKALASAGLVPCNGPPAWKIWPAIAMVFAVCSFSWSDPGAGSTPLYSTYFGMNRESISTVFDVVEV